MKSKKKKGDWIIYTFWLAFLAFIIWTAARGLWVVFGVALFMLFVYIGLGLCAAAKQADQRMEEIFNHEKKQKRKGELMKGLKILGNKNKQQRRLSPYYPKARISEREECKEQHRESEKRRSREATNG